MKRLLVAVLVALAVAACGSPAPGTGYVMERRFDAAHMEGAVRQRYTGERCSTSIDAKGRTSRTCSPAYSPYWEPNDHFVPDRWQLLLENCYSQEGCRRDWVTVTESTFAEFEVGEHYPRPR